MPTIAEQHAFLDAAKSFNFAKVKQLIIENPGYTNCQPSGRCIPAQGSNLLTSR